MATTDIPSTPPRTRRLRVAVATGVVGLLLGGVGTALVVDESAASADASSPERLRAAVTRCVLGSFAPDAAEVCLDGLARA
jgi:hypothetical protein